MNAAEAIFESLETMEPAHEPVTYADKLEKSWLWPELYKVRNIRPGFGKGLWLGLAHAAIDTYLLIRRCEGVASGVYRYDPLEHQLLRLDKLNGASEQLLQNCCNASGNGQPPDVLFQFAARYGRLSWKYEGLVYALTLKHVGVIMQQLYLVATALNLAPCSLGTGEPVNLFNGL